MSKSICCFHLALLTSRSKSIYYSLGRWIQCRPHKLLAKYSLVEADAVRPPSFGEGKLDGAIMCPLVEHRFPLNVQDLKTDSMPP